jgi:C1A family cysteine protease
VKKSKNYISFPLLLIILILIISFFTAASDNVLRIAPVDPSFQRYIENAEKGIMRIYSASGYALGEVPAPVDLTHIKGPINHRKEASYPSTYDLRLLNKLTPVKDQGGCGSCWAFATYGSLESYLMPGEWDFSEQDLNANHGFDFLECEGGNALMSTAYLARWDGPLTESDVPYPYLAGLNSEYTPQKHIQQVEFIPERTDSLDNDGIKYFVTNYGAVYMKMGWYSSAYNSSSYGYYYDGSSSTNHGVCIVGWDDDYDKNNFNKTPPGNGAFIGKNSWGTSWGDNGYFYISYYDAKLTPVAAFNNAEDTDNYSQIYQYDPLGWVNNVGYSSTIGWAANIFTSFNDQSLQSIGFYTNDTNVSTTIYIYKSISGNTDPTNGTLAASKNVFFVYPGYHTVKLDSLVGLATAERFSVVVKFENSSYLYPIAVEYPYSGYSSNAAANPGESFFCSNGESWVDATSSYSNMNVCIKAFSYCAMPQTPSDPFPADGSLDVSLEPVLSWAPHDADSWVVYFDTSSESTIVADVSSPCFYPGTLLPETSYSWRIVAQNSCGQKTGPEWSFTTSCPLPAIPANPSPADGATGVSTAAELDWEDSVGAVSYDIYFGTDSTPPFVDNLTSSHYDPGTLNHDTTYFWKVVAKNSCGESAGEEWNFKTKAKVSWKLLTSDNPEDMLSLDIDGSGEEEIAADFGAGGLWLYEGAWRRLTGDNPENIISADIDGDGSDEIIGDFGAQGIWVYINGAFIQICKDNPENFYAADTDGDNMHEIIGDFGSSGLKLWNGSGWIGLSASDPEYVVVGNIDGDINDEFIVDFGSKGVWMRNNDSWSFMTGDDPEFLAAADIDGDGMHEIIGDFGTKGLRKWDGAWSYMTGDDCEYMIGSDIDGDGSDEIIGDFGSKGLWKWDGSWSWMTSSNAEYMISGNRDADSALEVMVDFGSSGLWEWDGAWIWRTSSNPEFMILADLDDDGEKEAVVDFGSLGLWYRK